MKKNDYVSYAIALILERLGFNWDCDMYFVFPGQTEIKDSEPQALRCSSIYLAQKWLSTKGIYCDIYLYEKDNEVSIENGYAVRVVDCCGVWHCDTTYSNYVDAFNKGFYKYLTLYKKLD